MKWIVSAVVVLVLLVAGYAFLGKARVEVGKDKVLKQVDDLLGETEVKRKEVQFAIDGMEKSVDKLAEAKINAKVQSERLAKEKTAVEGKIADAKNALAKLRDYVTSESTVTLAGKTYSKDDLNKLVDKTIQNHKTLTQQLAVLNDTHSRLEARATSLEERHEQAKTKLADLQNSLKLIDANLAALQDLKAAREAAGDGDKTLVDNYEATKKKVDDLDARIKVQLGKEDEKWKQVDASGGKDEVTKVIDSLKEPTDRLNEIDKILQGK